MPLSSRNKFKRALFGAEEKTHQGKYSSVTKGFLTGKNYQKPVRSVIIINDNDRDGVMKILKKFKAKIHLFRIIEP